MDVVGKGLSYDEVAARGGTTLPRDQFEELQDLQTLELIDAIQNEKPGKTTGADEVQRSANLGHIRFDPGDLDKKGIGPRDLE